jgi:type VI secretion system VasD/TssJ family lipoprotein
MTQASDVSTKSQLPAWSRAVRLSVLLLIVASMVSAGCGWIFGQRKKPMVVDVEVTGTDSLNFDGTQAQPVRLRIYCLKDASNFMSGDIRAFFDDTWNPEWRESILHKRDTIALRIVDLGPGETRTTKFQIDHARAKREKPVFAVIADFLYPPSDKSERLSFEMQKKWNQTIKITVGKNSVWRE